MQHKHQPLSSPHRFGSPTQSTTEFDIETAFTSSIAPIVDAKNRAESSNTDTFKIETMAPEIIAIILSISIIIAFLDITHSWINLITK